MHLSRWFFNFLKKKNDDKKKLPLTEGHVKSNVKKVRQSNISSITPPPKPTPSNRKHSKFSPYPNILYGINIYDKIPKAPNFTYNELLYSYTAIKEQIKNTPSKQQFEKLILTAEKILQPVRNEFGPVIVTSGYRCPDLCLAVGSTIHSNHTRGEAVDFYVQNRDINLLDVLKWIEKNLDFRELILEFNEIFLLRGERKPWIIHCAYRPGGNIKLIKHPITYKKISLDELEEIIN